MCFWLTQHNISVAIYVHITYTNSHENRKLAIKFHEKIKTEQADAVFVCDVWWGSWNAIHTFVHSLSLSGSMNDKCVDALPFYSSWWPPSIISNKLQNLWLNVCVHCAIRCCAVRALECMWFELVKHEPCQCYGLQFYMSKHLNPLNFAAISPGYFCKYSHQQNVERKRPMRQIKYRRKWHSEMMADMHCCFPCKR